MGHQTFASRSIRVFVAVVALLLAVAAPALAADGVPVFQAGGVFGTQFDASSQIQPDAFDKFLAFVATPLPGVGATNDSRVWVVNFQAGEAWAVNPGAYPSPVPGAQAHPSVHEADGVLRVVYEQTDASTGNIDLWLWEGDEHGVAAAGFPKPIVSGYGTSHQVRPSLGKVEVDGADHLVLAWEDDQFNGALLPAAAILDLTTTDYKDAGFNPAWAGVALEAMPVGQHAPRVGPKGIVFLDDRDALATGEKTMVRFWELHESTFVAQALYEAANDWDDNTCPVPTLTGAAWLGPAKAGGPFQPYMKPLGGTAKVLGVLYDPGELDSMWQDDDPTPLTRLALTGRHGATDRDYDVFFYDTTVKQMVPVCTVGSKLMEDRDRLSQTEPAISWGPPPASGVVWADARHDPAGTAYADLTYKLYMTGLPAVTLGVNRATLRLGGSVTFTA